MREFGRIQAWRLADDLTVAVYERTRGFPREEVYGLMTSQLRRLFRVTEAAHARGVGFSLIQCVV